MKSGPSNGKLYTEEDWNTDSEADKEGGYMYSKVGCLNLSSALQLVPSQLTDLHGLAGATNCTCCGSSTCYSVSICCSGHVVVVTDLEVEDELQSTLIA